MDFLHVSYPKQRNIASKETGVMVWLPELCIDLGDHVLKGLTSP